MWLFRYKEIKCGPWQKESCSLCLRFLSTLFTTPECLKHFYLRCFRGQGAKTQQKVPVLRTSEGTHKHLLWARLCFENTIAFSPHINFRHHITSSYQEWSPSYTWESKGSEMWELRSTSLCTLITASNFHTVCCLNISIQLPGRKSITSDKEMLSRNYATWIQSRWHMRAWCHCAGSLDSQLPLGSFWIFIVVCCSKGEGRRRALFRVKFAFS